MKRTYTPGPWVIESNGEQLEIKNDNDLVIALCDDGDRRFKANARLIAAAPELLDALRALLEQVTYIGCGTAKEQARQAIKKATGDMVNL